MKTNWGVVALFAALTIGLLTGTGEPAFARESLTVESGRTVDEIFVMGKDIHIYGTVEKSAVSLGGDIYVERGGYVEDDAVSIGGTVYARSGSRIDGDAVTVGGSLRVDPGAAVDGSLVDVLSGRFNGMRFPAHDGVPNILRLIVLGPFAGVFGIIGAIIGLSLSIVKVLISLGIVTFTTYLFPANVVSMSEYMRRSPVKTFLAGFVGIFLVPFIAIGLLITLVGIPLIPLLILFIVVCNLFGSAGISLWIGRLLPNGETRSPMRNVIIGVLIVALLKLIPGIGFLTGILLFFLSLGIVLFSRFGNRPVVD